MEQGLLWFDNDPKRKLADKIVQAVARYTAKFGRNPTVCYTNSKEFRKHVTEVGGGVLVEAAGVRVDTLPNMLPYHFWVGVEERENYSLA